MCKQTPIINKLVSKWCNPSISYQEILIFQGKFPLFNKTETFYKTFKNKAESKANFEEAKAMSNPERHKAKMQEERDEKIAEAKKRQEEAQARIDADITRKSQRRCKK